MAGSDQLCRRDFLRHLALGITGLSMAACTAAPTPAPPAPTQPAPAATSPQTKPAAAATSAPPKPTAAATVAPTKAPATPRPLVKAMMAHPSRNITVALFHLAKEKGYFREAGVDLELQQVPSANTVKAMLTGEIDFIGAVDTPLAAIITGNAPLKIVYIETRGPIAWLYARPPYKTVQDLRGKNIVISAPNDYSHNLARAALASGGLDPENDVTYVAVPGASEQRLRAVLAGSADAGVMTSPENIIGDQQGMNKVLFLNQATTLGTAGAGTTDKLIKEKPEVVRGFVEGSIKAIRFMKSNKAQSIPLLAPFMNTEPQTVSIIYDTVIGAFIEEGYTEDAFLQKMIDGQRQVSQIEQPIPVSQAFDMSFAKQAEQAIKTSGWKPQ